MSGHTGSNQIVPVTVKRPDGSTHTAYVPQHVIHALERPNLPDQPGAREQPR
jgi:hypothetical protein